MASRTRRLIIVVRRPGVYRRGGWVGGRSGLTRGFLAGAASAAALSSDCSTVGRTWVTASAKAALVPTGTMAVMACCRTAAAFRAFAAASSALADWSASWSVGLFSEGMTTVSASVSMSGRDAGSGPKTERLFLPEGLSPPEGWPARGLLVPAGVPLPSAADASVVRGPPEFDRALFFDRAL